MHESVIFQLGEYELSHRFVSKVVIVLIFIIKNITFDWLSVKTVVKDSLSIYVW